MVWTLSLRQAVLARDVLWGLPWVVKMSLSLHSRGADKDGQGCTLASEVPEKGTSKLKHWAEAPELRKGLSAAATSHSWTQPSIQPQGQLS